MPLDRLAAPFTLRGCLVGAAAMGAMVLMPVPEVRAACLPTDPSSICTTFDPSTPSNISATGGINETLNSAGDYVKARVVFSITGTWATPVTLTGIQLAGDGISGTVTLGDGSLLLSQVNTLYFTSFTSNFASIDSANLNNSRLTFTIPGSTASPGASIQALIQYSDSNGLQVGTSGTFFTSTSASPSPVPGPLPILGAAAAFGFSRKLRRRIRQSA